MKRLRLGLRAHLLAVTLPIVVVSLTVIVITALKAHAVSRVAGSSGVPLSCLVMEVDFVGRCARICNAGHTPPLRVMEEGEQSRVVPLDVGRQAPLGVTDAESQVYTDEYVPIDSGDYLVIYCDGLASVKDLKAPIFNRLLHRHLCQAKRDWGVARVRDEVVQLFHYYLQGKRVEDDVCYLIVQMVPEIGAELSA